MVGKGFFYLFVFAAAVGLPYFASEWTKSSKSSDPTAPSVADGGQSPAVATGNAHSPASLPNLAPSTSPHPTAPPLVDYTEALRFDVTPQWIFSRWPRVTAGLPIGDLQGYRVPLVTGVREYDLAGALTYFFDAQQRCREIRVRGTVGDPSKLAALATGPFRMQRRVPDDPATLLFQSRWNGKPTSELTIRPQRVVESATPHSRYEVELRLAASK